MSTTRIADLPENITVQMQPFQGGPNMAQGFDQGYGPGPSQGLSQSLSQAPMLNSLVSTGVKSTSQIEGLGANTYMPLNIHPNPFGPQGNANTSGGGGGAMPFPENVHESMDPYRVGKGGLDKPYEIESGDAHRLPSRDIPMNITDYTQDEEVQANYIPRSTEPTDYIRDYEEAESKKWKRHEEEKYRKESAEDLVTQFQTPVIIALMYFIFQMPVLNRLLFKYGSMLPFFREDGNLNLGGMCVKSVAFASVYFLMERIVQVFRYM
jgi:hypothetical protein